MRTLLPLLLLCACNPTLPEADRTSPSITAIDVVSALPDELVITIVFDEAVVSDAATATAIVESNAVTPALLDDAVNGDYRQGHLEDFVATQVTAADDVVTIRSSALLADTPYTLVVSPVWRDGSDNPLTKDDIATVITHPFTTASSAPTIIHSNIDDRLPRSQTTVRLRYDQPIVIDDAQAVEQSSDHRSTLAIAMERNDVVITRTANRCDDPMTTTTLVVTGVRGRSGRVADDWQQTLPLAPCVEPLSASITVMAGDAAAHVAVQSNRAVELTMWVDLGQQGEGGPRCWAGLPACPWQLSGSWSSLAVAPLAATTQHRLWWLARDDHDQQVFGEEVFTTIDLPDVGITEVMANPTSLPESAGEYIEIRNHGDRDIELSTLTLAIDDRRCPLPVAILPAGAVALLGGSGLLHTESMVVTSTAATLCGALRNGGGQTIVLSTADGLPIQQWTTVDTADGESQVLCADGAGPCCAAPPSPGQG